MPVLSHHPYSVEQQTLVQLPSFTTVGSIHLHVDGGSEIGVVKSLVNRFKTEGYATKLHTITDIVAGPQRQQQADTYASHTPGSTEKEHFEFFSTIGLSSRDQAISTLKLASLHIADVADIVIEVEHVVADIDKNGTWSNITFDTISGLTSDEVGIKLLNSLPFEIHHCIDIYDTEAMPLNMHSLMQTSSSLGISLGGWFYFVKDNRESYRSNAFSNGNKIKDEVHRQYELLNRYMQSTGLKYSLKTVVEKVLAIWRSAPVNTAANGPPLLIM